MKEKMSRNDLISGEIKRVWLLMVALMALARILSARIGIMALP